MSVWIVYMWVKSPGSWNYYETCRSRTWAQDSAADLERNAGMRTRIVEVKPPTDGENGGGDD